jgi:hypothetical protein
MLCIIAGSCSCSYAVGVCWWVLVSVFTCNAPQSIELELYRDVLGPRHALPCFVLEVGVAPD